MTEGKVSAALFLLSSYLFAPDTEAGKRSLIKTINREKTQ